MAPEKKLGGSLMRRVGAFPAVAGERKVCVGGGHPGALTTKRRCDVRAGLQIAFLFVSLHCVHSRSCREFGGETPMKLIEEIKYGADFILHCLALLIGAFFDYICWLPLLLLIILLNYYDISDFIKKRLRKNGNIGDQSIEKEENKEHDEEK